MNRPRYKLESVVNFYDLFAGLTTGTVIDVVRHYTPRTGESSFSYEIELSDDTTISMREDSLFDLNLDELCAI